MVRLLPTVIVTWPSSASTRSCGARRSDPRSPSASISNASAPASPRTRHDHRRAVQRALEHVERAEVDGADDLRRRRLDRSTSTSIRACTPARLAAARSSATSPPTSSSGGNTRVASSCTSVNARRASRCSSSRIVLAAAGSESSEPAATSRLAASPTRSCSTPSCRARSIPRRSASATSASRFREARSSPISRRSSSMVRSSVCSVSSGCLLRPGSPAVVRHRSGVVKLAARYRTGGQHPGVRQASSVSPAGAPS